MSNEGNWTVAQMHHDGVIYTIATNGSSFRIRSPGILALEVQIVKDKVFGRIRKSQGVGKYPPIDGEDSIAEYGQEFRLIRED